MNGKAPLKTKKEKKENREYKNRHGQKRSFFPTLKRYKVAFIIMAVMEIAFLLSIIVLDILPGDLTLIAITGTMGLMILANLLFEGKRKFPRILGILVAIFFVVLTAFITEFMGKTYAMMNKISDTGIDATGPMARSVAVTQEPFNIYITGIDQWAKDKGQDLERSDVNMLVTIHPVTKNILLTSIPRDTYVKLHTAQQMDKLTHTGIYGVEETLYTVEDWLDIDINYYVKMNFTGARDIINAMGGVMVYSPVDFTSTLKGYEYHKGWNDLTGKEALYFARERKAFEGQDAMRVENQQRVIEAMINKMTSSTTLIMHYGDIMDAAGEQMQTNFPPHELSSLAKMQISDLASWDVQKQKIEGQVDQDYVASLTQSMKFDIYRPSDESVESCKESIDRIMNPTEQEIELAEEGGSRSFVINMTKRMIKMIKNKEEDDSELNID